MPIVWKYLSKEYLKVFFLSVLSFISILLIMRLKQIATFATLSSDFLSILLFIIYQIPHILPIAISISCLISSSILFQRMSKMHEITAFRACGISLKQLLAPLMLLAIILSVINFIVSSEITPTCKFKSKELFYKNTSVNPLILLQRQNKMSNIKDSYIEITTKNNDQIAKDLLIIIPNKSNARLCMLTAKDLILEKDNLNGNRVTLISYLDSNKDKNFDNLLIENQNYMTTKANILTQFIKSKQWDMNISSMPIKMLLAHMKINGSQKIYKSTEKVLEKAQMEITRRFALALSTFCFTFIGASFGISINRVTSKKNMGYVFLFTMLVLFSFTLGKALKKHPLFSIFAYIFPQILVIILTANKLKKISRGLE